MLELKKISKIYNTDDFKQKALDEVTLNFRKNEFASILGPSGSGKTTLLNIIGGLDKYTSGDLVINEVSTKKYNDRDWDSYRNHRIGFVFQSYNLIPHQSVLSNVELALTLSGVSKKERKKRAKEVLKKVGLEHHINKKPNQLSGGQMQRVAIARALVNNPDILLLDEPTGALDTETSIQIMNLLKEIAKDKLIIMVTHNPELADMYSNRIIKLKDGKIIDDSNPYDGKIKRAETNKKKKKEKTSMSLFTALSLSLNNLLTKKGRTILTAFAGSIGIIGIALILSLSNGVTEYIDKVEKETLSNYPISIEENTVDLTSIKTDSEEQEKCETGYVCVTDNLKSNAYLIMKNATRKNNLSEFKKYLDDNTEIQNYITDISYSYDFDLQIYTKINDEIVKVNPNTSNISNYDITMSFGAASAPTTNLLTNVFNELIDNEKLLNSQYEILAGNLPKNYDELVLVLDEDGNIPLSVIYSLGIENRENLIKKQNDIDSEDYLSDLKKYNYSDLLNKTYKLILNADYYKKENNIWVDKSDSDLESLYENGLDLKIVGIIKIKENSSATSGFIGYNKSLINYVIEKTNEFEIVKEQLNNKDKNIFTDSEFDLYSSYEDNLKLLGYADISNPTTINIYPKDFESKEKIEDIIKNYNKTKNDEDKIEYTDYIGMLLSGVTTIINVISYILIAFVAISLIVSSIMIAIITYISVLERTKEIGILRAIGASKKDVKRVFIAETMIEGFISGLMGILITILLTIPINKIVYILFGVKNIAKLPINAGITLVIISVLLTVIAGLVPSKKASKKDPVESLRTE
jgi:putative ABC transport system permease protein